MNSIFLSLFSGALLSLSFSSFNLWFFAWVGLVPLFFALENRSLRGAFFLSFLCGLAFWVFTVYWLVHVTLLGLVILVFYLALFFGLFGASLAWVSRAAKDKIFPAACLWVLIEYLRSYFLTGFPWALLGFSQYKNLAVIQIADISGAWGVSFLVILVNSFIYSAIRRKLRLKYGFLASAVFLFAFAYGLFKLNHPAAGGQKIKICVVQGNIPQNLKWDKHAVDFIQNRYEELTLSCLKNSPDLIIWPEASIPVLFAPDEPSFQRVYEFSSRINTDLLAGAVSSRADSFFNSALFISSGKVEGVYDKLHLVPFGEFIPMRKVFSFLQTFAPIGEIAAGKEYVIFKRPRPFGVLICFEDLFPALSRNFVRKGASFLVNITNDAWYKESSAASQHFAASVFRAVENRRYLARSANTGISGFISPQGEILASIRGPNGKEIFSPGFSCADIYVLPGKLTFYTRFGDIFAYFCLALSLYFCFKKSQ